MTKYYFVSYIYVEGARKVYGNCLIKACKLTLTEMLEEIRKVNGFKTLPTIDCLKDLSKEEYEMLKGGEE